MENEFNGEHLNHQAPAIYRIEVEGQLEQSWSDRLAGMQIRQRKRANRPTVSIMTGKIRDQAELTGVINSLYELHLPILSVINLSEDKGGIS